MIVGRQKRTAVYRLWPPTFGLCCVVVLFFTILDDANGQAQPIPAQEQQPPPAQPTAPWYETLPAVAMDYKVIIDPGKEDCYFQFVNPGATFYASAQVLRGGDGMAGFAVRHPNGQIVHPYQWKASSDYQDQESTGGYYSVCIDNQFSKFAAKLVNLYITVIRYDKWDEYHKEIEDMNVGVENFTSTVKSVENNINHMLQHQHHVRSQENRDYNLLVDNKTYVNRWSIMQILLIMGTTTLQVYFVRKLFETKTGKSKTRA
ncbi:PREDICTED: transmembrane emp24 domain-containing protein 6 [Diuraphis noxia]|uniref:transmembrane emp24 domain-containing protein 6 n=1 Tax=Diuraphis noxia TaxID=143948 RepID=UPI000763A786|nr:PREDICTED: transmembrane emp24 domain-containing protein 6 [Diuraphis noxia]